MIEDYVTKRYARERMRHLIEMCPADNPLMHFLLDREKLVGGAKTIECRKYLLFDTIEMIQRAGIKRAL